MAMEIVNPSGPEIGKFMKVCQSMVLTPCGLVTPYDAKSVG